MGTPLGPKYILYNYMEPLGWGCLRVELLGLGVFRDSGFRGVVL